MSWTNLSEVMRDLSVAQGGNVPASLQIFCTDDRPSHQYIESEDEYNLKSFGDVHLSNMQPDYNLIQEMLTMVNKKDSIQNNETKNHCKFYNVDHDFLSQASYKKKNKSCRNVAINSILENICKKSPDQFHNVLKSPVSMFKRKSTPDKSIVSGISPVISETNRRTCEYIPSEVAKEYYKKYLENSKFKERNNRNISPLRELYVRKTPLERKQRYKDNDVSSVSLRQPELGIGFRLTCQRHSILDNKEDCVVCRVFKENGYNFNGDNIEPAPVLNSTGLCIRSDSPPLIREDMTEEYTKAESREENDEDSKRP